MPVRAAAAVALGGAKAATVEWIEWVAEAAG